MSNLVNLALGLFIGTAARMPNAQLTPGAVVSTDRNVACAYNRSTPRPYDRDRAVYEAQLRRVLAAYGIRTASAITTSSTTSMLAVSAETIATRICGRSAATGGTACTASPVLLRARTRMSVCCAITFAILER